jgi:hypothetical protein
MAQGRLVSEAVLKKRFEVELLLFSSDGFNAEAYPGEYNNFECRPVYGNCIECYRMGPLGRYCRVCAMPPHQGFAGIAGMVSHPFVMVLAEKIKCDTHERWYNPEFLHNTNGDTTPPEDPVEGPVQVHKCYCRRERWRPYPPGFDSVGPTLDGHQNFGVHMRAIYRNPVKDDPNYPQ